MLAGSVTERQVTECSGRGGGRVVRGGAWRGGARRGGVLPGTKGCVTDARPIVGTPSSAAPHPLPTRSLSARLAQGAARFNK